MYWLQCNIKPHGNIAMSQFIVYVIASSIFNSMSDLCFYLVDLSSILIQFNYWLIKYLRIFISKSEYMKALLSLLFCSIFWMPCKAQYFDTITLHYDIGASKLNPANEATLDSIVQHLNDKKIL